MRYKNRAGEEVEIKCPGCGNQGKVKKTNEREYWDCGECGLKYKKEFFIKKSKVKNKQLSDS